MELRRVEGHAELRDRDGGELATAVKGPPRGRDRDSLGKGPKGAGMVPVSGQGTALARLMIIAHGK